MKLKHEKNEHVRNMKIFCNTKLKFKISQFMTIYISLLHLYKNLHVHTFIVFNKLMRQPLITYTSLFIHLSIITDPLELLF